MNQNHSIAKLQKDFIAKKLSSTELTKDYFKKIKASKTNAYLALCEERALKQAKTADEIIARDGERSFEKQPLLGIPLGIKDVLTMDGVVTTCGSKMLENYVPPFTATAVIRLENAGAVSLGKLNMDEFAMGSSNENSAFGPVIHPTHPDRVPGGSSGGSATSVGADLCVASLGTDTGGSIRLPASFTGIVGLKPTYGRISRYGLIAFASSLDQIGPMTKNVDDAARLLQVMSGADEMDATCAPNSVGNYLGKLKDKWSWSGVRIGIPKEYFVDGMQMEVEASVRESLKKLESLGAKLVDISLPHSKYAVATYYLVSASEASSNLARFDGVRYGVRPQSAVEAPDPMSFYKRVRANFGPEVKRRILLGTFALASGYYDAYYKRACQVRRLMKNDFDEAFKSVDLIASAVGPTTAFKFGEKSSNPLQAYLMDILTIPASLAGLPGISVPCGVDAEKLPIGIQFLAPHFEEERLLQAAHSFETEVYHAI
ncbi:MAG: Asp-tRNA(Asn)/Glu-tRNA(Gln) amidotransferase subunit GatA [Xanthomonadaceae bacterium]|nr:Asp-tRNA(Asn)/Glu-tRNA(Gln) amidotransferase subunit GatA [Xanthomonadaceae bacterium]